MLGRNKIQNLWKLEGRVLNERREREREGGNKDGSRGARKVHSKREYTMHLVEKLLEFFHESWKPEEFPSENESRLCPRWENRKRERRREEERREKEAKNNPNPS